MARIETDPNYTAPTFPRATAATDLFKKEDVQALASAISTHDHSTGKGVAIPFTSIPAGTITSGMIADATIVAADIADGAITSAKIADGTIATVDIANAAVTNAKLGPDTARANLLTNGGFEQWQRGAGPFVTAASGIFTADRWQSQMGGAAGPTVTVTRETTITDNSPSSLKCVVVGASATQQTGVAQPVEAGVTRNRQVTFSVRARCDTGTLVAYLLTYDSGFTYTPVTLTTSFQTFSVTWTPVVGTVHYHGFALQTAGTFYVDNAMLVVGSQAADYAPLHPADDLARCLRYYEVVGGVTNGYPSVLGYANVSASFSAAIGWKTTKAITPTTTKNGTWGVTNCSQPSVDRQTLHGCRLLTTSIAAGACETYPADAAGTITVEANP